MRSLFGSIVRFALPIWVVTPMLGLVFMLGLGGGYLAAMDLTSPCPLAQETCAEFTNFWKAWQLVTDYYVEPAAIDPKKMTEGAIEGMLDSLGDRGHTRYLSAKVAVAERESLEGRFEGIGAYIDVRDDQPLIVQPIEGSPAEQAGLRPGDLILKVDGQDVIGFTVEELVAKVRGPKGTKVTLTILHAGEELPLNITVTRDSIEVPSISWRMLPNNVAYMHLNQFSSRAGVEVREALTAAQQQGAKAIIFDVRNNPGGLVNELLVVASQFLPANTTVLVEQDRSGEQTPEVTQEGGVALKIPVVVLVNGFTASSAEILAGALKEHERATVIGVPTFGTATVLRVFELNGGAQLRIGTTQWLTPKGQIVRGVGIQPDEVIGLPVGVTPLSPAEAEQLSEQELRESEDAQLVRALELVWEMVGKQ